MNPMPGRRSARRLRGVLPGRAAPVTSSGRLGDAAAAVAGVVAALGRRVLPRLGAPSVEQLPAGLPAALDLLAACLAAGTPVVDALEETAAATDGPVATCLARVAAAARAGAPAREAWDAALGEMGSSATTRRGTTARSQDLPRGGAMAAVARACVASEQGGTPLETSLGRIATEQRAAATLRRQEAARRAGVLAVLPLGLCFLPAYLLLGVVPAVAGLAARFG